MPDFRGLPRPFWVLFAGTFVNRIGGFVLVFLAIYLTEVHGLTPAQAGAVLSAYGLGAIAGGPVGAAVGASVGAAFGVGAVVVERGKHIHLNKAQQLRIKSTYETQIR